MSREIRLSTSLAHDGYHQRAWLSAQVTVGQIASTLADHDGRIEASGLELARPIAPGRDLETLELRSGDRLLMFARPPRLSELPLPPALGDLPLDMRIGLERGRYTLRASSQLPAEQVAARLARHFGVLDETIPRLYILRALPPHWTLAQIDGQGAEFLYAALDERRGRRLLSLIDLEGGSTHHLRASDDAEMLIGTAQQGTGAGAATPDLDIGTAFGKHTPTLLSLLTPHLLRVHYRAFGDQWWMRLDERSPLVAYLNQTPLDREIPMRLLDDDEVSLGISAARPYARFRVRLDD